MAHDYDTKWQLLRNVDAGAPFTEFDLEALFATVAAQLSNDGRENGVLTGTTAAVNLATTTHYLAAGTGRVNNTYYSFAGSTVQIEDLTAGCVNYVFLTVINDKTLPYSGRTSSGLLPRCHAKSTDSKDAGDIKVCEVTVDASGYITAVDNSPANKDYAYNHQFERIYGSGTYTNVAAGGTVTVTVDYSSQATGAGVSRITVTPTQDIGVSVSNRQDLLDGANFTFDLTNGRDYAQDVEYTWWALVWSV